MSRSKTASVLRASLAPFVVVGLAACGGGSNDPGQFFEDLLEDAGFGEGNDDDGGDGDGGDIDGGDDGDGGERGPDDGPPVDYILDAVNTETDGSPAVFVGATGRWFDEINGTILGAARVLDDGAESMNLRFDGAGTGTYNCASDAVISYNALADDGSPLFYSSRPEGASCIVVVETYGEVGERIRGWFDATLIEGNGNTVDMAGAFDVARLADN